jgi:hypothetical protein
MRAVTGGSGYAEPAVENTDPAEKSNSFSLRITCFPLSRDPHRKLLAYLEAEEIVRSAIRETIPPTAVHRLKPCDVFE